VSLRLEGTTATAALHGVGVLERKALLFQAVVPIDGCAIEIQSAFFVDDNGHAVAIVFGIGFFVERIVEVQRVAETAAAAGRDAV
jgi:hypothetical protein